MALVGTTYFYCLEVLSSTHQGVKTDVNFLNSNPITRRASAVFPSVNTNRVEPRAHKRSKPAVHLVQSRKIVRINKVCPIIRVGLALEYRTTWSTALSGDKSNNYFEIHSSLSSVASSRILLIGLADGSTEEAPASMLAGESRNATTTRKRNKIPS